MDINDTDANKPPLKKPKTTQSGDVGAPFSFSNPFQLPPNISGNVRFDLENYCHSFNFFFDFDMFFFV
jgi:hypothetical protein